MKAVLVGLVALSASVAVAEPGDPFTTLSPSPLAVSEEGRWFAGIDQSVRGTVTRFLPVAYAHPKWRKARGARFKSYSVDTADNETESTSMERAAPRREQNDAAFASYSIVEADPIRGGFTGRYRIPEMSMVVYLEEDQVIARTGDISVMRKLVVVKAVSRLTRKCPGKQTSKLLHVVARPDWKAVAVYVESTCEPESDKKPGTRVRKLFAADVSSIL